VPGSIEWAREARQRAADLALWAGRPADAIDEARRVLALYTAPDLTIFCGRLLATGMRACADLAGKARARRDDHAASAAQAAADDLVSWVDRMAGVPFADHPFVATNPAERATWDAERTRLAGASNPAAWSAAAKTWEGLGCPHLAGCAWWRGAAAWNSAVPGEADAWRTGTERAVLGLPAATNYRTVGSAESARVSGYRAGRYLLSVTATVQLEHCHPADPGRRVREATAAAHKLTVSAISKWVTLPEAASPSAEWRQLSGRAVGGLGARARLASGRSVEQAQEAVNVANAQGRTAMASRDDFAVRKPSTA
jgi:hypothetical protein